MKDFENFDIIRVFNKQALENNLIKTLHKFKNKTGIVIKSNAYGIGIKNVLPIFEKYKISNFFCQDIIEALDIKNNLKNKNANIYTFAGMQENQEKTFIDNKIIPICVNLQQIENFNNFAKKINKKPKIAIHFDTGMNRTGLNEIETDILAQNFKKMTSNLEIVLYVSHLHSSYEMKNISNKNQLNTFKNIIKKLPKCPCSLSATGGSFRLTSDFHFDIVRVGYGIYGMLREMEAVISVYAKILQIREVKKNSTIGYFAGYKANKDMKIAILNIGYKDGYLRSLSHTNKWKDKIRSIFKSGANFAKSYMVIDKYKCPVIGIISMNNTIIDISNVPEEIISKTTFVEVIGKNANIMDFREANGFIPCDLLTSLLSKNPNAIDLSEKEFIKEMKNRAYTKEKTTKK